MRRWARIGPPNHEGDRAVNQSEAAETRIPTSSRDRGAFVALLTLAGFLFSLLVAICFPGLLGMEPRE